MSKVDTSKAEAPTHLDGSPVDKDEAARVHAGLASGELKIEALPEAMAELEAAGISMDDLRAMLMASTKKTMS